MNNIKITQAYLQEASEIDIKDMPSYIHKELEKLGKIISRKLSLDEKEILDGMGGIITGVKIENKQAFNIRFKSEDFAKLSRIKGLRWMEVRDKGYLFVAWEHKV